MLVKVEDKGHKFILRVFDFKPESLLTPAEIAMISKKAEEGEKAVVYERGLRLYDTAIATIIAQIDKGGKVHGPTSVPSLFKPVETLAEVDLEQLRLDTGDLPIGYVRVGHRETSMLVCLDGEKTIPHHILVAGSTGAGKSNLGKVLAASIMASGGKYSLIIFDCESEYLTGGSPENLGLAHLPWAEERLFLVSPRVGKPGRIHLPLRINGVEIERSVLAHPLAMDVHRIKPMDLILTGEFSSPQEEFLWLAYRNFGDEWIPTILRNDTRTLYRRLDKLVSVNTINVTKRKVRYLVGRGDIFSSEYEYDLAGVILSMIGKGMVVLIETPFAGEGEEKLLATLIANRVFYAYEKMRKELPDKWFELPNVLIMVEEAHRYLSKASLTVRGEMRENVFSVISKRGRKYKVGGLYITQMPGELMETVIRQTLTKIILPLPTRPDYMKVINYSPYLDEAEQEIKTLDRGEALLVSTPSGIRFAVPVKIFSFEEMVEEIIKNFSETRTSVRARGAK